MNRPEQYRTPHRTRCSVPYTVILEPLLVPTSTGGVLSAGQLLWTNQTFSPKSPARVAIAFVEGKGTVLIDPRWLTIEDGPYLH